MSRLFTIPDIHGRKDLLDLLLKTLNESYNLNLKEDKLIFLGDMIDRGANSKGVLDCIRGLQDQHGSERVIALAGNHEWLMIDGCIKQDYDHYYLWLINGGNTTLRSFPGEKIPDDYLKWCASLPLFHQEEGYFFSHAPIDRYSVPTEPLPFKKKDLIWTYHDGDESGWTRKHEEGIIGVCGHIHRVRDKITAPRFYDHYYFLDCGSGCSDSAPLVAVEVKSKETIYAWPKDLK